MSTSNTVPEHFKLGDSLALTTSVHRAIDALGGPPKGYEAAHQAAREAEFAWVKATSLNLALDVQRLAEVVADVKARRAQMFENSQAAVELDRSIEAQTQLLNQARELVGRVPEEGARLALQAERADRARRYQRMREDHNVRLIRGEAIPQADAEAMVDLSVQVKADADQTDEEREAGRKLYSDVAAARSKAIAILSEALDSAVVQCADEVKAALSKRQVAIAGEYPTLADPAIAQQFKRAEMLAEIAASLDSRRIDVEATFERELSAVQFTAFSAIIRQHSKHRISLSAAK